LWIEEPVMEMTFEEATRLVEEHLRTMAEEHRWGQLEVFKVIPYRWGWEFYYGVDLIGAGPIQVNKMSGELSRTGSGSNFRSLRRKQERIAGLRPWWKIW
jgi:hypothetical protein